MDIQLNYIDRSEDAGDVDVVIFQKNVATDFDSLAVAWKVIRHCGRGNYHPFVYPMVSEVSCRDSWGNYMPKQKAYQGQLFHVALNISGNELRYKGAATSNKEIQIQNDLVEGVIAASIFKDGRALAQKTGIAPGQKAVFLLKPVLYLAVASEIEEGQVINSAVISAICTEISLHGLTKADIVMTGGGAGKDASNFQFTLENIEMA